jgi:hypothetical protein
MFCLSWDEEAAWYQGEMRVTHLLHHLCDLRDQYILLLNSEARLFDVIHAERCSSGLDQFGGIDKIHVLLQSNAI